MQKDTQNADGATSHLTQELGIQEKPTFKEWLNQNKIEFTPKEALDWTMLAAKKACPYKNY